MDDYKIIFAGPVGAGKTTAITTVSETPPLKTEENMSEQGEYANMNIKTTTTMAMDYGKMSLGSGKKVHLYGTPGQKQFDFMWEILSTDGMGVVILINDTNSDGVNDLEFFIDRFSQFTANQHIVVAITHVDLNTSPSLEKYQAVLEQTGRKIPMLEVDARDHSDMTGLLDIVLRNVDPELV